MKIGFDDDTSQTDIYNLEQQLIQLRNPALITLGVKTPSPSSAGNDVMGSDADRSLLAVNNGPKKVGPRRESNKNKCEWINNVDLHY